MHKLFFIDCDGTLLNKALQIESRDLKALLEAIEKGYEIILCSGRPYKFLKELAKSIHPNVKVISFNGAMIEDEVLGYLDSKTIDSLLEIEPQSILFKSKEAYYSWNHKVPDAFKYDLNYPLKNIDEINHDKIIKCLIYKWLGPINLSDVSLYQYEDKGYEILPKCTSKGQAIQTYLKRYQEKVYTISIGDDVNDLSMFEVSDVSYLMKHANRKVKEKTDAKLANSVSEVIHEILKRRHINETH